MAILENRASTILYNILMSIEDYKPFLMPSNVCPIVPITFLKARKAFEFVDISETTFCIDEQSVIDRLRKRPGYYGGVLFVRTYGIEGSYEYFFKQIKEIDEGIIIIDDKCLAMPDFSFDNNSLADITLFSSGYGKFVDLGYAGYASINDKLKYHKWPTSYNKKYLSEIIKAYKYAIENKKRFEYSDTDWLDNNKSLVSFPAYQKLIAREIEENIKLKNLINQIYVINLPSEIQLESKYQNWRFNILVPQKELLLENIFKNGLFASSHYASLDGIFSSGKSLNAEKLHSNVINLFNDKYFSKEKAEKITDIVNEHISKYGTSIN